MSKPPCFSSTMLSGSKLPSPSGGIDAKVNATREHSCPSCGFELDRDWNAALNVLSRGLDKLGVVHSEDTPVETATAVSTDGGSSAVVVDASRVVEAGSSALKEAASAAE